MHELIPSILVQSEAQFVKRLQAVESVCKTIHIDVLDNTLFPSVCWADPARIKTIQTNAKFEIHLMVTNPKPHLEAWKPVQAVHRAIIHAEIPHPLFPLLQAISHEYHWQTAVALNPETSPDVLQSLIAELQSVLVMGVHPGASGQHFLGEPVLEKIRYIKQLYPHLPIEIDGGVTADWLPHMAHAGVSRFCAASLLFSTPNPQTYAQHIQSLLSTLP